MELQLQPAGQYLSTWGFTWRPPSIINGALGSTTSNLGILPFLTVITIWLLLNDQTGRNQPAISFFFVIFFAPGSICNTMNTPSKYCMMLWESWFTLFCLNTVNYDISCPWYICKLWTSFYYFKIKCYLEHLSNKPKCSWAPFVVCFVCTTNRFCNYKKRKKEKSTILLMHLI